MDENIMIDPTIGIIKTIEGFEELRDKFVEEQGSARVLSYLLPHDKLVKRKMENTNKCIEALDDACKALKNFSKALNEAVGIAEEFKKKVAEAEKDGVG